MKLQKRGNFRKSSAGTSIRTVLIQSAGILSYIILLLMRIPLSKVIGDAGMGLFAPAFEIFMMITFVLSYSMTGAMSGVIRYRVKREQHRNAKSVFHAVFLMNILLSVILGAALVFAASKTADFFVLESLSRMAVLAAAPAILFSAVIGTFRGYFNGYGLGTL